MSLFWSLGGPFSWVATQHLTAAETAFGRCFFAFLGLSPFLILDGRRTLGPIGGRGLALLALSGLVLGVHFFLFVSGVAHASLATAVTLVAVEPALVLSIGVLLFKENLRLLSFFGIVSCVLGIVVICALPHLWDTPRDHGTYGDLCAVFAVLAYGLYYALNRAFVPFEKRIHATGSVIRRGFGLASFIYFFAALATGVILLASGPSGSSFPTGQTISALVGAGLIPTVLGHTLSQIVSRTAHPVWVSLMSPGETLCALGIGYAFLGQKMNGFEAAGGLMVLLGVALTVYGEARAKS